MRQLHLRHTTLLGVSLALALAAHSGTAFASEYWEWIDSLSRATGVTDRAPVECEPGWISLLEREEFVEVACSRVRLPGGHPHARDDARVFVLARDGEAFAVGVSQAAETWEEGRKGALRVRSSLPRPFRCGPEKEGALRCVTDTHFVAITGLEADRMRRPGTGLLYVRDPRLFARFRLEGQAPPASPAP